MASVTIAAQHGAVLLAGGLSSRMGQDKALLTHANQTLLESAERQLQDSGCDPIWISRNSPGFLTDRYPESGPLAGIDAALAQIDSDCGQFLTVLPVDMPLMDGSLLVLLQQTAEQQQRPCCFDGSVLPAVLPVTAALKNYCQRALEGEHSVALWRLFKQFDGIAIDCPDPQRLVNTNTPDEWQAFQQQQQHRGLYGT